MPRASRLTGLSIVFPAFNEEANIAASIAAAHSVAARIADDHEVIVVDDGSRDGTAAAVDQLAAADPRVRLIRHPVNRGYGAAVWTGLQAARLAYVFFTDSDRQFDLGELDEFSARTDRYRVVVGYRENRSDPWHRRLNGAAWTALQRIVFGLRVRDVDCAFKLFDRRVLDGIEIESNGAFFSTELLVRLHRRGVPITEIPVRHYPRPAGNQTGAKAAVVAKAFVEMARFLLRMRR